VVGVVGGLTGGSGAGVTFVFLQPVIVRIEIASIPTSSFIFHFFIIIVLINVKKITIVSL
jgi:hypothetical protein